MIDVSLFVSHTPTQVFAFETLHTYNITPLKFCIDSVDYWSSVVSDDFQVSEAAWASYRVPNTNFQVSEAEAVGGSSVFKSLFLKKSMDSNGT